MKKTTFYGIMLLLFFVLYCKAGYFETPLGCGCIVVMGMLASALAREWKEEKKQKQDSKPALPKKKHYKK